MFYLINVLINSVQLVLCKTRGYKIELKKLAKLKPTLFIFVCLPSSENEVLLFMCVCEGEI